MHARFETSNRANRPYSPSSIRCASRPSATLARVWKRVGYGGVVDGLRHRSIAAGRRAPGVARWHGIKEGGGYSEL
jgi:hypothetical protein